MTQLQNVECCLLWFTDELPPLLLLKNAPGLLGLPQQPAPDLSGGPSETSAFGFGQNAVPAFGQNSGQALGNFGNLGQLQNPPTAAEMHDAKEYLQAANTRQCFMRQWHEQAYPAQNIKVPQQVVHAKAALSIPQDPWQPFPYVDQQSTYGMAHRASIKPSSAFLVKQPCWDGIYAIGDWEHVVTYLEGRSDQLQIAIGACFR